MAVLSFPRFHPHLFLLGTVIFLLITLFSQSMRLEEEKKFRIFMRFYKLGLPILALTLTLFVRGIIRVLGVDLSRSMDLPLSGVTGKIDEHWVFCYTMECKLSQRKT
ncbi:DUF2871 family protein [Kallipyga massiliensis]|uniref:DUF2871 family protein n=1 Tax=Kallipyga massiliensis TaxID=1472764 RepID=UPI0004B6B08D|nr:DUF2871 family protein [Kallipyga massiliensis]